MQQDIAGLPVRLVRGRNSRIAKANLSFVLLAALVAVTACGGDSSTGPTSDAGVAVVKAAPTPNPAAPATPAPTMAENTFWVNPSSPAKQQADSWRASRPADAAQMDKLASRPVASWFGGWNADIFADVNSVVTAATNAARIPVLVAYHIPSLNCSGGGATPVAYRAWIGSFASALAGRKAIVVLEPDALAGMDCLSPADQQTRVDLLTYAVQMLKSQPNVSVYLDGGNPSWQTAAVIANRLTRAGVGLADGFALNVSNFFATADNVGYGQRISALVSGKHFIVDTGRNGLGPTADSQWCNPDGRALGQAPTLSTGSALVDAFVWVKVPGESDGACNGGPSAGKWWGEYALGLVNRSTL